MLWPLMVASMPFLSGTLVYGVAMNLLVRLALATFQRDMAKPEFCRSTGLMVIASLITAAAHLTQIALWAAAFRWCGHFSKFDTAFYFSAQNYTALGYGDVVLPEEWRLLGPLEAVNGVLAFGLSAAVLFAMLSRLIAREFSLSGNSTDGTSKRRPQRAVIDRLVLADYGS